MGNITHISSSCKSLFNNEMVDGSFNFALQPKLSCCTSCVQKRKDCQHKRRRTRI